MAVFDFIKSEEKILKFWKDRQIFKRSLQARKHARRFVFFEGPPTANGRPGMHHFLGRVIKDLFVRFKTMRGYLVERRAGWDTHGLAVEIEVEKELGLKSKKEIEAYGIAKFNAKAKESVWRYKDEWERFTSRIGFWLDMDDPYVTYDWKYIETLWWVIKEIDKKKLFYKGHKVLPWCPRCGTALSSHEVAQGYQDVTEASVYIKFKVKSGQKIGKMPIGENTYFLAWTTTPWTLPGNVALAVGKKIDYVIVKKEKECLILAKGLVEKVVAGVETVKEVKSSDLIGLEYEPLFDIPHLQTKTSRKIYPADFVTTEEGTGIVHTAVMYGEDDYQLGQSISLPKHHTVDETGHFTKDVKGFEGQFVKSADKGIIKYLDDKGLLFKIENHAHTYPFCWRCKSPLLYYARDSWFVAVSKLRKQLLKNNSKINWVPVHLKSGRFGEFIKDAKDWAFSRERYWGTPLPVWHCQDCKINQVVGSLDELEKYRYHTKNTFCVLRHGLSEKDHEDGMSSVTAGKLDQDKYDLTPVGLEQAETAAEKIKSSGGVDVIYSSPFRRTQQTAHVVAKKLGLHVHTDDRLRELDHGSVCEGQEHAVCLLPDYKPAFDFKYGDGESWADVRRRMFSLIKDLDQKYEGKKILLVGHGDPIWILEALTRGLSDQETIQARDSLYIKWGEFKIIDFKNFPYNDGGSLDMHRPYIDEVFLKCQKCNGLMKRVPEVVDGWFDSGAMPYAQLHYPFSAKGGPASGGEDSIHVLKNNFPAEFIAEGIDQTRGWFYTLLAVSTALGRGVPYKNVVSYSHVLDEKGKKMSKSLGNAVDPWGVIEQFGVDAARWYFYTINDPADSKSFTVKDVQMKLNGFITTLLNSLRFLELYAKPTNKRPKAEPANVLDQWILSRLHGLIRDTSKMIDAYNVTGSARAIEGFVVNDLSNWWIRRSRERFQRPASREDFAVGLRFFRYILSEVSKLLGPFVPFLAEHIYKKVDNRKESVHLEDWPKSKKKFVLSVLDQSMAEMRSLIAEGLAQRKSNNIKVRQPLASATIKKEGRFEAGLERLLMDELNVKWVLYDTSQVDMVRLDYAMTEGLVREGYAREIMRQIQDIRKESGYKLDELVSASWESNNKDVIKAIDEYRELISKSTLLRKFDRGHDLKEVFDVEKEFDLAPQAKIWLGVRGKKGK